MCQIRSNPPHTIIEVSEMFQEFLKHASIDGFVESWCLEITLQSSAGDVPKELPIDCMHHLIGLHSLNYLILKKLDAQHHEVTSECCSCGWDVGHMPEFQHSDIGRYTPGTTIRWSQGACHVLLAPSEQYDPNHGSVQDPVSEVEETQNEELGEAPPEEVVPSSQDAQWEEEEEVPVRSGVIHSTEQSLATAKLESEASAKGEEDIAPACEGSRYFIKHQHFCEQDEVSCPTETPPPGSATGEGQSCSTATGSASQSPAWPRREEELALEEDTFANDEEDDEENSRMLVINEDDSSQTSDRKEDETSRPPPSPPPHAFAFFRVLTHADDTTTHPSSMSQKEEEEDMTQPSSMSQKEEEDEEDEEEGEEDDDSSSVTSSSSSSSSSTSSSSSSDDDDRINFKKRVEQAAQAAREAAASAAATASSLPEPPFPLPLHPLPPLPQVEVVNSPNMFGIPPKTATEECHDLALDSFPSYRHPDDIQAAQGLAALGKSHEMKEPPQPLSQPQPQTQPQPQPMTADAAPQVGKLFRKASITSKIVQKLLQNKTVDVRRVGPTSFQCGVCGKLFCRLTKVLEHHVSHTGEKPWECDSCDRKFAKYYSMQKHKRVKHTPAHLQKFTCYICDKNFSVQSVLQMHLDTHATLKPFPCAVCGQTFALKFTKDAHEAQHTGNRQWCCNVCGKSFVTKYKLKAHMKAHTGELFCAICNRTFGSQDVLTRHRRRHEAAKDAPPGGPSNPKQNTSKANQRTVTKGRGRGPPKGVQKGFEPPPTSDFRCQMCSKMFSKSTDLTHHLASCNAITYCPPPSTLQPVLPGALLPQGAAPQPLLHQPLPSNPPLPSCMLGEEKKLVQFVPSADVSEGIEPRSYLMTPFQEPIIPGAANPVTQPLPDYLSEVAFGTAPGGPSAIIFQPAHEQT